MICPNCKQENADGSVFCGGCGSRLQPPVEQPFYAPYGQQSAAPQPYAPQSAKPKKPVNKKLIGILCGAGAAVVLVVVLLVVLLGGGKGYETVAKNYIQTYTNGDRRASEAYIYPELEDEPILSLSLEYYEELTDDDLTDPNVRIFASFLANDYYEDRLKDMLREQYELSPRRIGDVYLVAVAITFKNEAHDGEEDMWCIPVYVAQIDGTWYVV